MFSIDTIASKPALGAFLPALETAPHTAERMAPETITVPSATAAVLAQFGGRR
jgi:hypothetical protein